MTLGLPWLRLVPLVALLWGLPTEVQAVQGRVASFHRNIVDGRGEAIERQPQLRVAQRSLGKQANENVNAEANRLWQQGKDAFNASQYQTALALWESALEIYIEIGNRQSEALSLGNLGVTYMRLGEYERSIDFLQQTLAIYIEIGDRQGEANSLGGLGVTYNSLGEYQRAIDFQQQSLAIDREIGDRRGESNSLEGLGNNYYRLGEYERSIDFQQQSLAIRRERGDRQGEASSLGNLGIAYEELGEYERSIDFHQQSLAIKREIGDRQGEANSLGNLGVTYDSLGEYQRAIDFHQQYLAIAREIGDRQGEAHSLGNLGLAYDSLGEYQRAIDFHQQSLAIKREIGDRQGEAYSLNNLGLAWENQGHPETAAIFYKDSINVFETIRNDITGLEQTSQTAYIDSVEQPYRSLIDILLTQGRILEAQQVLELLKVEELREFTRATYRSGELQYDPIEEPVRAAHNTLINFGSQIYACGQTCDPALRQQRSELLSNFNNTVATFEDTVRANRADDDDFYDPQNFASDARRLVDAEPGTVLIYPIVLEDTLWLLWTATGGVVGSVEVPAANQADLSATALRFRELLTKADTASLTELKQVGQQLHSWLIEPMSTELESNNIQRLIFAQDRATRYIPMAALHDGEQFLIENYTVSTVLSADLTDTTDRLGQVEAANTLGLGLDQAVEGFNALPNVLEELQAVIKENATDTTGIYPGSVFMNENFTFDTLSEQVYKHRILHIATHAEFVPNVQDASYLLDGNGQQITIDQIASLALEFDNLHLVVLSACQTALGGPSLNGTEIAGVSSYFLGTNKAEAVLATLWRVNDAGTSLLMQRFYEFMATGELTKAEALRQAQLSLLNREATLDDRFTTLGIDRGGLTTADESSSPPATLEHPYYWAPFILIGNSL
ncbi:MAG: tetratricopeptide repeat protein [Cyanobacteria bacterium J06648_11]